MLTGRRFLVSLTLIGATLRYWTSFTLILDQEEKRKEGEEDGEGEGETRTLSLPYLSYARTHERDGWRDSLFQIN